MPKRELNDYEKGSHTSRVPFFRCLTKLPNGPSKLRNHLPHNEYHNSLYFLIRTYTLLLKNNKIKKNRNNSLITLNP